MGAGNSAYIELFSAYNQMKTENITLREELNHHRQLAILAASAPKPGILCSDSGAGLRRTNLITRQSSSEQPSNKKNRDDYPDVPFWEESEWIAYMDRQKKSNKPIDKLGFLTDAGGNGVDKYRVGQMTERAKTLWNGFAEKSLQPSTWKKKTYSVRGYFNDHMMADFPEFSLADGYWKLERFATLRYPDWTKANARSSTTDSTSTMRRSRQDPDNSSDSPKPRKRKRVLPPSDGGPIIENDKDGPR
ncbi:hypothetical protein C0992_005942, partial [Termitomyces sp. T32_za158]